MNESLSRTIAELAIGDVASRTAAAKRLAQAPMTPAEATIDLVQALDGSFGTEFFQWIEAALEKIETPPPEQAAGLVAVIQRFLNHPIQADAAFWATTMLGRIGPEAECAVPALTSLLDRNDHPNLQFKAAWALGKIGPAAKLSAPNLARAAANAEQPRLAMFARQALDEVRR